MYWLCYKTSSFGNCRESLNNFHENLTEFGIFSPGITATNPGTESWREKVGIPGLRPLINKNPHWMCVCMCVCVWSNLGLNPGSPPYGPPTIGRKGKK
jgi:hypothetical protein